MQRKIAISAAFILTMVFSGLAQNDVRFGFQVSPTVNWMSTNNNRINSAGTNLGLKLGMTGEFYFRENYAFTSGLGFWVQKKVQMNEELRRVQNEVYELEDRVYGNRKYGSLGLYGVLRQCRLDLSDQKNGGDGKLGNGQSP